MKLFFTFILIFFIFSCGYPDIDTVPSFDELDLTNEESIDLCRISNEDIVKLNKCLNEIKNKINKEKIKNIYTVKKNIDNWN